MQKQKTKICAIPFHIILVLSMLFLSIENLAQQDQCTCENGTPVKFEWNKDTGAFELEGTNAMGIRIEEVTYDADGEPECVVWESDINWVTSVCIKASTDLMTTDYTDYPYGGAANGIDCQTNGHAISNIVFCLDGPLPVELTSFTVNVGDNIATLNWETATEVNNYGFEIQRSFELENWNKVGFVEGHGNSNSPKYYSFTDQSISGSGEYYYRLKQIDIDGQFEYSDVVNINFSAPLDYELNQNYPNPFNPSTTINYSIPQKSNVKLVVYNLFGEEVARLVNETKDAGRYSVSFKAQNMASGMYFYSIETENYKATKKFILLK